MYEQDLAELNNFISQSTRPNVKRQLEEYRKNISALKEEEKKKLNVQMESENNKTNSTQTTSAKLETPTVPITKYAFDNGDKFVK